MKHMNRNLAFLLSEGFSIKTLEKMNNTQLSVLSEKVKKSEAKEQTTKTTTTTSYTEDQAKGKTFSKDDDVTVSIKADGSVDVTKEGEMTERAVSKQQQKLMGLALSVKRGDTPKSKVSKKIQDMSKKMSEKDLEDFASTKHKGLPKKKKKGNDVKQLEENIMNLLRNHFTPTLTKSELLKSINNYK